MPAPPSLSETAARLAARGKGILASDESVPTIGKRLEKAGLANDEPTRRAYRDIYYCPRLQASGGGGGEPSSPLLDLGAAGLSGAILFREALGQSCCAAPQLSFVEGLLAQGVLVGVKVDSGLEPLRGGAAAGALAGETQTRGLDALPSLVREVAAQGASFAKFRCAQRMAPDGRSGPSEAAVDVNARQLAEYAAVCQAGGGDGGGDGDGGGGGGDGRASVLVPIVEPELLIDGKHDAAAFEAASARVISSAIAALWRQPGASLEGLLLKPQMVVPGSEWRPSCAAGPGAAAAAAAGVGGGLPISPDEVAARTLRVMRACVPPAVQGIMFLSGGQTEQQATENLDAINAGGAPHHPWALSFSFGRGLQASVLRTWSEAGGGKPGATDEEAEAAARCARRVAVALVEANGLAARGQWRASGRRHPSVMEDGGGGGGGLHETFRGHY